MLISTRLVYRGSTKLSALSHFYKEIDELFFAQLRRPQSTPSSMVISKTIRGDGPNYGSVLDAKRYEADF